MAEAGCALVTGASSGIGLACTRQLLEQGYLVAGISRRGQPEGLEHDRFVAVPLDLSEPGKIQTELDRLLDQYSFGCLVHAAGQGHFGSIEQFSVARIEQSLRVNLTSAMVICRALVPAMRRLGGGRLVFIGSESALAAGRKGALYSAAKFGLRGFCQALRADCAADGIRVSLINPGMVRSPFFDELAFRPGAAPENALETDDVARTVVHILQAGSEFVIDEINLSPRIKSIDFGSK